MLNIITKKTILDTNDQDSLLGYHLESRWGIIHKVYKDKVILLDPPYSDDNSEEENEELEKQSDAKFQELDEEVLSLLKSKNINYEPSETTIKTKINSLISEFRSNVTVDIIVESTTEIYQNSNHNQATNDHQLPQY